jgi:predicted nucleic acid-binding protein
VKLYADEAGHGEIRDLGTLAVSAVARVEVPAALWRKRRLDELPDEDASLLSQAFAADFHGDGAAPPRFAVVALTAPVLEEASTLVAVHELRACDAIQLACALAARAADERCDTFACFDHALRRAAAEREFTLVP